MNVSAPHCLVRVRLTRVALVGGAFEALASATGAAARLDFTAEVLETVAGPSSSVVALDCGVFSLSTVSSELVEEAVTFLAVVRNLAGAELTALLVEGSEALTEDRERAACDGAVFVCVRPGGLVVATCLPRVLRLLVSRVVTSGPSEVPSASTGGLDREPARVDCGRSLFSVPVALARAPRVDVAGVALALDTSSCWVSDPDVADLTLERVVRDWTAEAMVSGSFVDFVVVLRELRG
jgi:hypothetical protein